MRSWLLPKYSMSSPDLIRLRHVAIPWDAVVATRNRLIHGYFDINLDIVWDTVTVDLPPLVAELRKGT